MKAGTRPVTAGTSPVTAGTKSYGILGAGSSLDGSRGLRTSAIALTCALVVHALGAVALVRLQAWKELEASLRSTLDVPVEIEVNQPPPPPPREPDPPPSQPPPPPAVDVPKISRTPPRPRVAPAPSPPPSEAPPPPNQAPSTAAAHDTPPVFGLTMSSVVSGEAAMAVPAGNTTMTRPRSKPSETPPQPYSPDGTRPFVPAPEIYIATRAELLHEVDSESVYPAQPKALGIEGSVEAILDIDATGKVVSVRIAKRAGHGFDEAASAALKQFLFKPARASDGRSVPSRLSWRYSFVVAP